MLVGALMVVGSIGLKREVNMANNAASEWLEILACCDIVTRHDKCIDYAAKLDRLVETTRKLVEDADGDDPDYLTVTPALVEAVVSALRDIELTRERKETQTDAGET